MIFKSKEFKNVKEYNKALKDIRMDIKHGLKIEGRFRLDSDVLIFQMYNVYSNSWCNYTNRRDDMLERIKINSNDRFRIVTSDLYIK